MAAVETVRGPVDLGNLGQTLMHEHVFVLSAGVTQDHIGEMMVENPVRYLTPAKDGVS